MMYTKKIRSPFRPGRSTCRSAKHHGKSQSSFAGFLVLAVHVLGGLCQGLHGRVEIDTVSRRDLVAGDCIGRPSLYRTECAALNAWDLHVTGHWVTCHSEVMLLCRFRGVLD